MEYFAILIKYDEYGESEASGIIQPLHQGFAFCKFLLTLRLPGIIIHMDVFEMIRYDLADRSIVRDEICELQAPRTPVAAHLTDDILSFRLRLRYSLVYLPDGVDVFVIHLL